MAPTIFLAIFANGARSAHYALFVPTDGVGEVGKLIHVTGTTATGFLLEFKRNFDFKKLRNRRKYNVIPLAEVDEKLVRDTTAINDSFSSKNATTSDLLELVATTVEPPGPNHNRYDPSAPNCQDWLRNYAEKLVEDGLIDHSAVSIVENAPKVL